MPRYKSARPKEPISMQDMQSYMDADVEPWLKALIVCLWIYGIRITEALTRLRKDFTLQQGYMWLNAPPLKNPNEPLRNLPVSLETPFIEYLGVYLEGIPMTGRVWTFSSVWCWKKMKRLDETLTPHRFRHNRATKFALARAHPYELQSWLGHNDIRQASKYIHDAGIFAMDLGKRVPIT